MRPLPPLALALALALSACAYPRAVSVYDAECQVERRRLVLEVAEYNRVRGCVNEGCVAQLVFEGAVLATSTVISGSIVLVGNIVYWLEQKRGCPAGAASSAPASSAPASAVGR